MTKLREWIVRLWHTLRPSRRDEDLEQELRLHLELATEAEQRRLGSSATATRAAAIRSGGLAQSLEAMRDQRGLPWLDELWHDARYALRTLRRSPGFATVAILTLGLGIGATTAIYSVVDRVLLQPLPFTDADRLVRLFENVVFWPGREPMQRGVRYQELLDWRARTQTLSDIIAFAPGPGLMRTEDGIARLWGGWISTNAFSLLGTHPLLGRTFEMADDANPDVMVLAFDTWRRVFHANPDVVGRTVEFRAPAQSARLMTIIGVLRPGFEFPAEAQEFYTPLVPADELKQTGGNLGMIGRLRPGVSRTAAAQEANVIGTAIRPPRPADAPPLTVPRFDVQHLKDQVLQDLGPALRVLLAAVVVVLTIVCLNVANLLLARGTVRQREMAVRVAIGASRGRVMRQVLAESLVLAIAGGVLGALFAAAGVWLVKALAAVDAPGIFRLSFGTSILPRADEIHVDLKMFGVAFGIATITGLIFGALPALHQSRTSHLGAMGPRGGGAGRCESRTRTALVIGQLVMATMLLIGAGLLAHSFMKLSGVDRGYDPANVVAFQLVFPPDYSIARKADTIDTLLARVRAAPNVEAAGFTRAGVLIAEEIRVGWFVPSGWTREQINADPARPALRPVSPGFLTAMGVPILDGRELEAGDATSAMPAIVISRTVARRYFRGSPVGQVVDWHIGKGPPTQVRVVGVVEDLRNQTPDREAAPEIFIDYRQLLASDRALYDSVARQDMSAIGLLSFAVRTRGEPASAIPAISQIVRSVDPNSGIDAIIPLERLVASSVARQRFYAVLLAVFAAVAGVLAAIGIYGVLAYAVVQRTQEIGVRLALGARRAQVLRLVLRKGLLLTAIGVSLGLAGAAAGTRVLQGLLFGITPLDPTTFVAVSVVFGLVAMVACYVPARRATKVDPMVALRAE